MSTAFSQKNFEFTKRAHLAAQRELYPRLFPACNVSFEDVTQTAQDLEYAIDCQLSIKPFLLDLRAPIRLSVQERFRRPASMGFDDITVTEFNTKTGVPSELHKLGAHMFVYGFYDEDSDRLGQVWVVDVLQMQVALVNGKLRYTRGRRRGGDQTFLGFDVARLRALGALKYVHGGWATTGDTEPTS